MHFCMAFSAQRNQIGFRIATRVAAKPEVVHLQMLPATARLAAPSVSFQHPSMQFAIVFGVESHMPVLQRASFTKPAG